jgi:hypothetical protein
MKATELLGDTIITSQKENEFIIETVSDCIARVIINKVKIMDIDFSDNGKATMFKKGELFQKDKCEGDFTCALYPRMFIHYCKYRGNWYYRVGCQHIDLMSSDLLIIRSNQTAMSYCIDDMIFASGLPKVMIPLSCLNLKINISKSWYQLIYSQPDDWGYSGVKIYEDDNIIDILDDVDINPETMKTDLDEFFDEISVDSTSTYVSLKKLIRWISAQYL